MFADKTLLLLPECTENDDIYVSQRIRYYDKLNELLTSLTDKGATIYIPEVSENIKEIRAPYTLLSVVPKPDRAIFKHVGYNLDESIELGIVEDAKKHILKKNPFDITLDMEGILQVAKSRTIKVTNKVISNFDCIVYCKFKMAPYVHLTPTIKKQKIVIYFESDLQPKVTIQGNKVERSVIQI